MKRLIAIACFVISCNTQPTDLSKQAAVEILQADKDMNVLASKEGFYKALLEYADDSVIKPQDNELPIIGKSALIASRKNKPDTKSISWQPFTAVAAKSGDLGYTLGNWTYTSKDTAMYGFYYTIWKKQADGKWKFTIDGGNNTPKP